MLTCASRLAIVAYDAALKMQKPSAATRGHEMSGRMPQKSRSRPQVGSVGTKLEPGAPESGAADGPGGTRCSGEM